MRNVSASEGTQIRVDDEILLRSPDPADAEELFRLVDRNRVYLGEWLPWPDANRSTEHTRAFIREAGERAEHGLGLVTLIVGRGEICGVVGFNWIDPANRACEIGYWLSQDRQGAGIVTRSVRALIEYAFQERELNRINIPVAVGNLKSRAIPERLGFVQEGVRREAEWLGDHYVDHAIYALLSRDWLAMRGG